MLILGIESAGTQVGCAVGGHEGVLASAHSGRGRRHAEALAPQIDFVRRQAGIRLSEIGAVAVDVGPGLFTGLRVGIATAVAMAITSRENSDSSIPGWPWVTPSHIAGTPPAN